MPFRWFTLLLASAAVASAVLTFGPFGIAATAILLAIAFRARHAMSRRAMALDTILILLVGLLFVGVPWVFVRAVLGKNPEKHNKQFCSDHLNKIMLALGDYHQAYGRFPPACVTDQNGQPMHSWRVLLLPYLRCGSLYKEYNFNEPWNGPNNRKLFTARPAAYVCPSDKTASGSKAACTNYVAVVSPNAAWSSTKSSTASDVAPLNRTVMLVEVADADIPWTEPKDLPLDSAEPQRPVAPSSPHLPSASFFRTFRPKVHVALADGSVQLLPQELFDARKSSDLLKIGGFPTEYRDKDWGPNEGQINWPNCIAFTIWLAAIALLLFRAIQSSIATTRQGYRETK